MSKAETILIQQGLRGLDHDPGPIDGIFGAKTRTAAQAWLDAGGARAIRPSADLPISRSLYQGTAKHPVREIVVHCAATKPDWMINAGILAQVAEIRRWHVSPAPIGNGWQDIGYHWIIGRAGEIRAGRMETVIGAGVANHNQGVIHICLIGGHGAAANDRFDRHFTRAQDRALRDQIGAISTRTRIDRISGHNEWAAKACPGFNVAAWLKEAA